MATSTISTLTERTFKKGVRYLASRDRDLADILDDGGLPDMAVLRAHFSPDPASLPNVSVQLASLSGYEALIDGTHEFDTAGDVA